MLKYFDDVELYFLEKCKYQLNLISSKKFDSKDFIDSWYKLHEKNKSKYSSSSILLFRNWAFHIKQDSSSNLTNIILKLMKTEISSENFEDVFFKPLLTDIDKIFGYKPKNYIEKSYFCNEITKTLLYQKLIPKWNDSFIKHLKEDLKLSDENIELLKNKKIPPIENNIIHKITGSITPVKATNDDNSKLLFFIYVPFDYNQSENSNALIIDSELVNDIFHYNKLDQELKKQNQKTCHVILPKKSETINLIRKLVNLNELIIGKHMINKKLFHLEMNNHVLQKISINFTKIK